MKTLRKSVKLLGNRMEKLSFVCKDGASDLSSSEFGKFVALVIQDRLNLVPPEFATGRRAHNTALIAKLLQRVDLAAKYLGKFQATGIRFEVLEDNFSRERGWARRRSALLSWRVMFIFGRSSVRSAYLTHRDASFVRWLQRLRVLIFGIFAGKNLFSIRLTPPTRPFRRFTNGCPRMFPATEPWGGHPRCSGGDGHNRPRGSNQCKRSAFSAASCTRGAFLCGGGV